MNVNLRSKVIKVELKTDDSNDWEDITNNFESKYVNGVAMLVEGEDFTPIECAGSITDYFNCTLRPGEKKTCSR